MTYSSDQFEILVNEMLQSELSTDLKTDNLQMYRGKKYRGKSGHNHPIDVSAEMVLAGVNILIAVECKFYSRKVGIDDLLEFAARVKDIAAHKGVVVSTIGFQPGAAKVAKSNGIALVKACDLGFVPYIGGGDDDVDTSIRWAIKKFTAYLSQESRGEIQLEFSGNLRKYFRELFLHKVWHRPFYELRSKPEKTMEEIMKHMPFNDKTDLDEVLVFGQHGYSIKVGNETLLLNNNSLFLLFGLETIIVKNQ